MTKKEESERIKEILDSITEEEIEKTLPSIIDVLTTEQLEKADKNNGIDLLAIIPILIKKLILEDYSKKFIEDLNKDKLLEVVIERYRDKFFKRLIKNGTLRY